MLGVIKVKTAKMIKVIPASFFRALGVIKVKSAKKNHLQKPQNLTKNRHYKSHFRKNELLQNSKILKVTNFRMLGFIAVIPAQFFRVFDVIAKHDPNVIATPHPDGEIENN